MKENILEYKGYHTKIEYEASDHILHGKIEGIKDLVFFESDSAKGIEEEFRSAVDDYLEMCEALGQEPDKEYSGSFNVRMDPELHKQLSLRASKEGVSLNAEVEKAVRYFIEASNEAPHIHIENVEFKVDVPYNPVMQWKGKYNTPVYTSWENVRERRPH